MHIQEILKDTTNYTLEQFNEDYVNALENKIFEKELKSGNAPYTECLVRKKDIRLTPEEIVRQLYLMKLNREYNYDLERMQVEYPVHFGRETKRADIVIISKIDPTAIDIIVELKKPKLKDGKEQLKSYTHATGAKIAVWTNGQQIEYFHRKDPNYFEHIPDIPKSNQSLRDILEKRVTYHELEELDKLKQGSNLKDIILDMEDEVLANAGVDVFEEVFKLIYIKLFDEQQTKNGFTQHLEFRDYGESDAELKEKIQQQFDDAKREWQGIFSDDSKIELSPSHLSICVSSLQDVKFFNSNFEVIDDAFEYLIGKTSKGEKGQFFTPRYVIDMCVKMLDPKENEATIDTASGSCGFPLHSFLHVKEKICNELGLENDLIATSDNPRITKYVQQKVFGIDFDEKTVRVARMLNIIAGDGHTNVLHLNTLDYERWSEKLDDEYWQDKYFDGWKRLRSFRANKNSNRDFNFDIVMANPPFAGDIKESRVLSKYELGKKSNGKWQSKVGRDILFIERNLQFLKPGGRMAVVLPQGRFNNSSDKHIRNYIAEHCRILGVVGLHGNVFKPHTGTKTSVLLVQKWDDELCPKKEDYPIFFATMQEASKNNSGDKLYWVNDDGSYKLDTHKHLVVAHDLFKITFNDGSTTENGIAEAFLEFAKKEKLSFAGK